MVLLDELLLSRLLLSLTPRRIGNIIKTSLSFLISALLKKPTIWGVPPVLTIEPTNLCNLHCPLCTTGAGETQRTSGNMTIETFKRIMDLLGNDIFFLLIYHQGEPYINKHFFEFVEMAKMKNIYVTTSTNGHYFSNENIKKTFNCGLDSMIISLDGTNQTSYEKYRIGGNLDKVLEGTKKLIVEKKRRGSRIPNIALQFLVMKHNEHEIPKVKKIADRLGVDRLLIKNIEVRSLDEAKEWLPQNEKFRRYDYTGDQYVVKGIEKNSCARPWLSTLINWDGTFVPCCFDKNGEYPMGNVHQIISVDEMWKGSSITEFRSNLLRNRQNINICRNCNKGLGSFLPEKLLKSK
jgi:radical SAM protein with 4Fe4S-binding SPASM domain